MDDSGGSKPTKSWHSQSIDGVFAVLQTSKDGLSDKEAAKRQGAEGFNELKAEPGKPVWKMVLEQFKDVMVLILLAAAALSFGFQEWAEGIVILTIVVVNTVVSVVQERKAANALEALKNMGAPTAKVYREGELSIIPAREIVAGDVVFLEDGSIVPADIRLFETNNLKIQEAALTGESEAVDKLDDEIFADGAPLGDRKNMAYSSSMVMYGNGTGVVVGTGMGTEVGAIAGMLNRQEVPQTPLKRKLNSVGKTLSVVGLIVAVVIFGVGMAWGNEWLPMLMIAISLAISVIPEGLPTTATIVMAFGTLRMAKKNALVRRLPVVETLGSASVICCDKTGTLTQNRMTVQEIATNGDFEAGKTKKIEVAVKNPEAYKELIYAAALCNNAELDPDRDGGVIGDSTEGALIFMVERFGFSYEEIADGYPVLFEQPFDSERKRMSTVHSINGYTQYTKGAVDEMLPLCTRMLTSKGIVPMTEADKAHVLKLSDKMSAEALRVLGYAMRGLNKLPEEDDADIEFDMVFLGVTGMIDPPRPEVIDAIRTSKAAGIRTVMITGDHQKTAVAIGRALEIFEDGNTVISGDSLDEMTDDDLDRAIKTTTIFARVSPADKLRIVESMQRMGETVAMLGDGVNDAPALKKADIGVAMGKGGTDVAKDAADMLLLDDNFTTVKDAVKEGRRIYRNIQKVIQFLLAGNIAEILTLFVATVFNWGAPILALHVLVINLVTDTMPAVALGLNPASKGIMKEKPIKSNTLFERRLIGTVISNGVFTATVTLIAYGIGTNWLMDGSSAGVSMAFMVLAVSQMLLSLSNRSGKNYLLFATMLASAAVLAMIMFIPPVTEFLKLAALSWQNWLIVIALATLPLLMATLVRLSLKLPWRRYLRKV